MSTRLPVPTILLSLTAVDILFAHDNITNTSTSQPSEYTNVLNLETIHGVACIYAYISMKMESYGNFCINIYICLYFFHIFLSSTSNIYGGPLLKSSCFPSCGIIGCPWNLDSMRVFKLSHSDNNHIDATFQNIQQLIVAGNHHAEWFV